MPDVFIAGCGDIGRRIAARCRNRRVFALVRREDSAKSLADAGLSVFRADLDVETPALPDLSNAQVFYLAPPPRQGEDDPRLRRFLDALPVAAALIYLSTTAVYGDCGGNWIDETVALNPVSGRGRRRRAAEGLALAWGAQHNIPVMILRVPGIYGPGRLPRERLEHGLPVLREADSPWTNRIHADDLAEAALCVASRGAAGNAYNVSDGNPTSMSDYFNRCADVLGLPRPPQVAMDEARERLTPQMLSFLTESKRIDTCRLRALGWAPRYADLAAGLPACL